MEDTIKVTELLDELEDMAENARSVPLTNMVMVSAIDIFNIVREIRLALPNDIQQAKWIKDERDTILADAKEEYNKIIKEAEKQAEFMVKEDNITIRANELADKIRKDAENQAKMTMIRSYEYVDRLLYDMEQNVDYFNMKVFGEMYGDMEKKMTEIGNTLTKNRKEIKNLAIKTNEGMHLVEYDPQSENKSFEDDEDDENDSDDLK